MKNYQFIRIFQQNQCIWCSTKNLERKGQEAHHVFGRNRTITVKDIVVPSDSFVLCLWLCHSCHQQVHQSFGAIYGRTVFTGESIPEQLILKGLGLYLDPELFHPQYLATYARDFIYARYINESFETWI